MSPQYYVSTNPEGIEHTSDGAFHWSIPHDGLPGEETKASADGPTVLYRASTLLDVLDDYIFVAEPIGEASEVSGRIEVGAARLVAKTSWNDDVAARFALDCAEHVLGDAGDVALPNGVTLAEVLKDTRSVLVASSAESEHRLGILARAHSLRRLRRQGEDIGDLALALLVDDDQHNREAIEDSAWTTVAAISDAVLAAVEALRHLVLPRYVRGREDLVDAHGESSTTTLPQIVSTPWGPAAIGAEYRSPYVPAFAAARDAAARARDVARERDGEKGEDDERSWQASRLEGAIG